MQSPYYKTTFVTAWFNIYNDVVYNNKTEEWRFEQFETILKTGIPVCIYVSNDNYDKIMTFCDKYENLKIMKSIRLEDTLSYQIYYRLKNSEDDTVNQIKLPSVTHSIKDTIEYILLMNAKIEFVNDTINQNPWNSTHFAWIDFSIAYLLKDKPRSLLFLQMLSMQDFQTPLFAIPGCIGKLDDNCGDEKRSLSALLDRPFWRFCGSFFLGDKYSLQQFYNVYFENFPIFLKEYKIIVWEVNYWAWLEGTGKWNPDWYLANHNDTIFHIPSEYYIKCLHNMTDDNGEHVIKKIIYSYPNVYGGGPDNDTYLFKSSSPSYICFQGKHILNTRFVNYSYNAEGRYDINDYHKILHTKNIRSYLNDETMIPYCYGEMYDNTVGLESYKSYSHGLEDMRLFEYMGELWFICTNVNYNPDGKNRIMIGKYNPESLSYSECRILEPPTDTRCEKNWIPLVYSEKGDELYFIYSWSPMTIGCLGNNDEGENKNKLKIIHSYEIIDPFFQRVRGSTVFIKNNRKLLGVVHYSEECSPRKYYHMLVELDPETFQPLKYSEPFCFQHFGVEFCIGFTVDSIKEEYIFWVSKKDNDAAMIRVPIKEISLSIVFS